MKQKHYDYLVVGSGLYGATFARQATDAGKSVLVIDKRDHIAGNIYTKKRTQHSCSSVRGSHLPYQQ